MRFTYNKLGSLVLTLQNNFPSLKTEISGYIKPNGDYRVYVCRKDEARQADHEISFHTHPNDNPPSPRDIQSFLVSDKMKSHIILTPKRVFVITIPRRKGFAALDKLAKLSWLKATLAQWKRYWKMFADEAGLTVVQFTVKEFVNA